MTSNYLQPVKEPSTEQRNNCIMSKIEKLRKCEIPRCWWWYFYRTKLQNSFTIRQNRNDKYFIFKNFCLKCPSNKLNKLNLVFPLFTVMYGSFGMEYSPGMLLVLLLVPFKCSQVDLSILIIYTNKRMQPQIPLAERPPHDPRPKDGLILLVP